MRNLRRRNRSRPASTRKDPSDSSGDAGVTHQLLLVPELDGAFGRSTGQSCPLPATTPPASQTSKPDKPRFPRHRLRSRSRNPAHDGVWFLKYQFSLCLKPSRPDTSASRPRAGGISARFSCRPTRYPPRPRRPARARPAERTPSFLSAAIHRAARRISARGRPAVTG